MGLPICTTCGHEMQDAEPGQLDHKEAAHCQQLTECTDIENYLDTLHAYYGNDSVSLHSKMNGSAKLCCLTVSDSRGNAVVAAVQRPDESVRDFLLNLVGGLTKSA